MPTSTVENYLKQLFIEEQKRPDGLVSMGRLAEAMQVTPGTATAMIKTLAESRLVEYAPRIGVRLSDEGERLALHVLRRHRILELFLVQTLGLDWSEVHDEADQLEHAVSDAVLESMDNFLGRPEFDPHGDPIPSGAGTMRQRPLRTLAKCESGLVCRIARVTDQSAQFLQFVDGHALKPGTRVEMLDVDPVADTVSIRQETGEVITIGTRSASKFLVEPV